MGREWKPQYESDVIWTGNNSCLHISLIETEIGKQNIQAISLRKWAKYVISAEKAVGLTKNDVSARPTAEGVSIPACRIDDLISELLILRDKMEEINACTITWKKKMLNVLLKLSPKRISRKIYYWMYQN